MIVLITVNVYTHATMWIIKNCRTSLWYDLSRLPYMRRKHIPPEGGFMIGFTILCQVNVMIFYNTIHKMLDHGRPEAFMRRRKVENKLNSCLMILQYISMNSMNSKVPIPETHHLFHMYMYIIIICIYIYISYMYHVYPIYHIHQTYMMHIDILYFFYRNI